MRIKDYDKDSKVTGRDLLLGTDGDNFNRTKNFSAQRLAEFVRVQLDNAGVSFKLSSELELPIGEPGYLFSDGDILDKTLITTLYFSKDSFYGVDLADLFNSIESNVGDFFLSLTQEDDATNYGIFSVSNVVNNEEYYTFTVSINGGLFAKELVVDKNYILGFNQNSGTNYTFSNEGFITV